MIKQHEIVQELTKLVSKGEASTEGYRTVVVCLQDDRDKTMFIHFWQEHAKMVHELQDKIRWLGGSLPTSDNGHAWARLHFRNNVELQETAGIIADCEQNDSEVLQAYEYALKSPFPADVRNLLKLHVMKIQGMQQRVVEYSTRTHQAESLVHRGLMRMGMKLQAGNPADRVLS